MNITESNCNYHLTRLYDERDKISFEIDKAICTNKVSLAAKLEQEYIEKCDLINTFLQFRKTHKCLLAGDPGYGPV